MTLAHRMAVAAILILGASDMAVADDSPASFLESWAAAWRSSDVDKMMSFYDTAKETTAIESLGHIRKGPAEIRKMYQGAFDEVVFERVTLTPLVHGQQSTVAWASCRYRAETRLNADNSKYVLEVRGTFVMKRVAGSWKITLEHFSTIPDVPRVRPAND